MHGSNAAKLLLPAGCRLHPVFNVDLLRKFIDGRAEFPHRTVTHARPGPLPEEREEAGGPGEPIYEVEAVIGKRGRGARLQYKVRWVGWPIEQASWLPARECESCADAVADFEQQQLQRQRRVAAIHQLQERRTERTMLAWRGKRTETTFQLNDAVAAQAAAKRAEADGGGRAAAPDEQQNGNQPSPLDVRTHRSAAALPAAQGDAPPPKKVESEEASCRWKGKPFNATHEATSDVSRSSASSSSLGHAASIHVQRQDFASHQELPRSTAPSEARASPVHAGVNLANKKKELSKRAA